MAAPTEDPSSTDVTLTLNWVALSGAQAGNSDVIAYSLYWDNGVSSAEASIALTDALVTKFTVYGVTGGTPYKFRVRARNIYGYGDYSPALTLVPHDLPGKTAIPTVALSTSDDTAVEVSWALPNEHSSPITKYEILFMQANGDFVPEPTFCDGTNLTIVTDRKCTVPMGTIRTLTLLPRDSLIRVKVRAYNMKAGGSYGQYSEVNTAGATIETEPTNWSVVSIDVPATSNVQTRVTWTALTGSSRGGKNVVIEEYEVYWDQSTDNWVSLATTPDLFTVKTGLTGGVTYKFKVRAKNKYGVGPFTATVSVQTSQAPDKPAAPVLEVVGGYVKISWTEPTANFRPVLGYQVLIETSTVGTFVERKALCDGDAQATPKYCLVDMHDLRAAPFGLPYDRLIRAEVIARNERGESTASDPNSAGARVQVEPYAVPTPTRGSETGPTQIQVNWSSLSGPDDNGGSAVLSYHLEYDNGTNADDWSTVIGKTPNSLATSVIVSS
jgi:hypothetical protein